MTKKRGGATPPVSSAAVGRNAQKHREMLREADLLYKGTRTLIINSKTVSGGHRAHYCRTTVGAFRALCFDLYLDTPTVVLQEMMKQETNKEKRLEYGRRLSNAPDGPQHLKNYSSLLGCAIKAMGVTRAEFDNCAASQTN
jgi:hypothetical protein